ncbi:calcineurin-binding protein 1 [Aristolochia californica]|uniref:calcineurin-binding protein 1 n=1 Tax=Aristolochia californica TaxID=171875 RepID=UPI0035DF7BC4
MFSIAAINDTDSGGQWEPLGPTKEAQEFHLSQTYHEGLLQLQAKNYDKARELLESALKDPLISNAQMDKNVSDGHLLQLRFLALKNLAIVFLQQGSTQYESALSCYLQAVEIDSKDSVVWNQLGTLSCSMGLLSISRWAFEQGLFCSPNNSNCMEKLLEVLIAIRDEVACLSVAELILRHWPSHSRALYVKNTIQESEPIPFAPRGIDKLEPKHVRLKFPEKRKQMDDMTETHAASKRLKQNLEVHLREASWSAIVDAILNIDKCADGDNKRTLEENGDIRINIVLPSGLENVVDSAEGKIGVITCENMKEKETGMTEEHTQERRSTRLERLRSRKPGKEGLEFVSCKDPTKVVLQFLEPFIMDRSATKNPDCAGRTCSVIGSDIMTNSLDNEESDVSRFVMKTSHNFGAYHLAHLVLEEVACKSLPHQECFVKFLELDKLARCWGQDRTAECSLFLAEFYYDYGSHASNESKRSQLFSEASYHLCKIIEFVALDSPAYVTDSDITKERNNLIMHLQSLVGARNSVCNKIQFWIRFFWLSGRLSVFSGDKDKACKEFYVSLSLLSNIGDESPDMIVSLPHCKLVRGLTVERILHEIHLLDVDSFLRKTTSEMSEKETASEHVKSLGPLLLSTKDVYLDLLSCAYKEGGGVTSVEFLALDVLISSCEKANLTEIEVYLNSHLRKLQLLTFGAGMVEAPVALKTGHRSPVFKTNCSLELELAENVGKQWICMVAEEVRAISQSASRVKCVIDQGEVQDGFAAPLDAIGEIQYLLLTVMCNTVGVLLYQKSSGSGLASHTEQLESRCFVDAAIAFCKLQHLNPAIPVKTQVDLIVAMHDLLAEYGLCCAGKDSEGEGGIFLKLAIKHLLVLDMKLKSNLHSNRTLESKEGDLDVLRTDSAQDVGMCKLDKSESGMLERTTPEQAILEVICSNEPVDKDEKGVECGQECTEEKFHLPKEEEDSCDAIECGIDNALNQCFFCLYGLNLRSSPDSSTEDDLAIHKNTSRGDYQTKEQCADVFHYILSYAKGSSRSGLIKLRRVLRAIRGHFPQPPEDVLKENPIDKFLDDPNLCEDKLSELAVGSGRDLECIISTVFPDGKNFRSCVTSSAVSNYPYLDVYGNLYYLLAQAEEMTASDKWPGFVLTKEGEDFVEQNAHLFKYDLLYNPLRFETWQRLAHIYDEEVDLLLNDGSKHINVVEWRKHPTFPQRVEASRRRARRCSLMSVALAKNPSQKSQMHELLALVYYDSLQNVVPFYDQRTVVPVKDAAWMTLCQNSMKHFEKALHLKPDWSHAFYLGKLCEKMRCSKGEAFVYYSKTITMNPSAVDAVYRMHASRLKLLYRGERKNLDILKVVAAHCFSQSTKDKVLKNLGWTDDMLHCSLDVANNSNEMNCEKGGDEPDLHTVADAWNMLYDDCLSALEICVEGELKHFHKARYMLAKGLYKRGSDGDLERAKEELSFCFKSSRSSFTINMWEIDGMVRKGRRKTPGLSGNRKALEVSLSESSRKFITCIRQYVLLYLSLLQKSGDFYTLDRAYCSIRNDKRFSLCLEDIAPVALGRYIQALAASINNAESLSSSGPSSREHQLDRMFNLFIDHCNLWADISCLPEMRSQEFSESALYCYIHEYIQSLERSARLDMLEAINEKIRKRFKNPKLSNANCAKICKHTSVAWCRSILISLALITPVNAEDSSSQVPSTGALEYGGTLLYIDLQTSDLWSSPFEDMIHVEGLDTKWAHVLNKLKGLHIKQVAEENIEAATSLLRSAYSFYRESSCGTLPSGVILYTVPYRLSIEEPRPSPGMEGVEILDLSIQRKLLLWAYTLVFGRYSNILSVVKHCEETAKSKIKRGAATSSALAYSSLSVVPGGTGKEKTGQSEVGEVVDNQSSNMSSTYPLEVEGLHGSNSEPCSVDTKKTLSAALPLQQCNNSSNSERKAENTPEGDNILT